MRREAREEVDYTLTVKISRRGHDPVISHGTAVKCTHNNDVRLYDELETEIDRPYPFPEDRCVTMKNAGVGLVLDHRYHVSHLELMRARLRTSRGKLELEEVTEDLWYCIMFLKGHFWARYDWVEVVTQPVAVQSARGAKGPAAG